MPLPFAAPRVHYSATARQLCIASITRDGMPFSRVPERAADDFHLYPATSTVWEWHRQACDAIALAYENLPKTNNHAENQGRRFRKRQKSHYKLRRTSTIDRAMKAELMRQKARKQARGDPRVPLQPKVSVQTLPAAA